MASSTLTPVRSASSKALKALTASAIFSPGMIVAAAQTQLLALPCQQSRKSWTRTALRIL